MVQEVYDRYLRNCPFCGKHPSIRYFMGNMFIECNNEKCKVQPSTFLLKKPKTVKELVRSWNERKGK